MGELSVNTFGEHIKIYIKFQFHKEIYEVTPLSFFYSSDQWISKENFAWRQVIADENSWKGFTEIENRWFQGSFMIRRSERLEKLKGLNVTIVSIFNLTWIVNEKY